jgi:hypothetical protein
MAAASNAFSRRWSSASKGPRPRPRCASITPITSLPRQKRHKRHPRHNRYPHPRRPQPDHRGAEPAAMWQPISPTRTQSGRAVRKRSRVADFRAAHLCWGKARFCQCACIFRLSERCWCSKIEGLRSYGNESAFPGVSYRDELGAHRIFWFGCLATFR